jgi:hypothetical protein
MAEVMGKVTNIKVASFLQDSVNSFDTASITLVENAPPHTSWLFYIWNSKDTDRGGFEQHATLCRQLRGRLAFG